MSTERLSKIKTARKPATGNSYPCAWCGLPIYPGQEYFNYQSGQRTSTAVCLKCIRNKININSHAHALYVARYGITGGGGK